MSLHRSQTFGTIERHLAGGRITAAIEEYHKLVNRDPSDLSTMNTLGDLYARAGLNNEAKRIFWRVARGYHQLGFTSKAIAVFKKLLRIDANDFDTSQKLAECYLAQGLRGEAARHLTQVAAAFERAGRDDQTLAAYQRITEIDPSNAAILMKLGERWLSYGLIQRAYDCFSAAGRQYSIQGNKERALTALLKARALQSVDDENTAAIPDHCYAGGDVNEDEPFSESLAENSGDTQLAAIIESAELTDSYSVSLAEQPMIDFNLDDYRSPGSNRRRTERVSALMPIVVISETGDWREFTQTMDVSGGGLKFQLAHAVPPLTVLRVSVNLEKWPQNVSNTWVITDTEGIVCYCDKRPGQPSLVGFDLLAPKEQFPTEYLKQSGTDSL